MSPQDPRNMRREFRCPLYRVFGGAPAASFFMVPQSMPDALGSRGGCVLCKQERAVAKNPGPSIFFVPLRIKKTSAQLLKNHRARNKITGPEINYCEPF